jgi:hypothetical protein
MLNLLFASKKLLISGAITGFTFGFLLHKGRLTDSNIIIGQFLFRNFIIVKTMLIAICIGGMGIYIMRLLEMVQLHIKGGSLASVTLGGLLAGMGMAILGYCPGTAVAAIGQGSKDALMGVIGMIGGTIAYAYAYPFIKQHILALFPIKLKTLPQLIGIHPFIILAILAIFSLGLFKTIQRHNLD